MELFRREQYLSKTRGFYHDTDLIKVITGVRRCGKSSLMEMIKDELITSGISGGECEIMRKLLKNEIFKSLVSTFLFGVFYALLTFVVDGFVEIDKVLISMVSYFLFMCLLYFVAPKLRKITGHDKDNN